MGQAMKALKRILPMAVWVLVFGYLIAHAIDAEHGMSRGSDSDQRLAAVQAELDAVIAERERLEDRVARLDEDSGAFDPDYLEERARERLGFVHPDDYVIRLDQRDYMR